ncbi:hypothetical protein LTS12_010880 [Elasticomyces elasticus]|nr:hypothetical protein LTS12_010880 [Elasticomyces elasticus]
MPYVEPQPYCKKHLQNLRRPSSSQRPLAVLLFQVRDAVLQQSLSGARLAGAQSSLQDEAGKHDRIHGGVHGTSQVPGPTSAHDFAGRPESRISLRLIPKPGKDITFKRMSHLSGFMRNSDRWVDLPVTKVLGFPLRLMAAPGSHPTTLKNPEAMRLGTIPFPEDPNFGASQFSGEAEGAVMIMRADGQDMYFFQLRAMGFYVMQRLNELPGVKARESKGKSVDREELAGRLLTPVAFRKYWDKLKASDTKNSADDGEIWKSVECPIKLD